MKKHSVLSIIILMLFIAIISSGCDNKSADADVIVLTIKDIQGDPLSFTGEITITGINAGFYPPDPSIFFVVDTAELLACKSLGCGAFQLPVIYAGSSPMPELADEINITGSWGEYSVGEESIPIFVVTKIDVKRNIMSLLMS
jgi:hypothetical protein